jgi:disulfide bond formation protein DsbB
MRQASIAMDLAGLALALLLGALGFQYIGGLPPCEMCMWQRWPLLLAIVLAVLAGLSARRGGGVTSMLAWLTVLAVFASGAIGAYQAGVEWHWWQGPSACTGARVVFRGFEGLNAPGAVRCDLPSFRFLGLSLAGWNAVISCLSALICAVRLAGRSR